MRDTDLFGVLKMEHGAFVWQEGFQMDVFQSDLLCMADGESPRWLDAVGGWLRVVGLAALSLCAGFGNEEGIPAVLLLDVL